MATIIGIDAAWTAKEPSGVALVTSTPDGWRSIATAPSYDTFIKLSAGEKVNWGSKSIKGGLPDIPRLLVAARHLAGEQVHLVTIDMPVANVPFTARREADDAISREFGGRWCSAHTPSSIRPGKIGQGISKVLQESGYPLSVDESVNVHSRCLLEVYPHPALLSLLQRDKRVPYKVSKSKKYWPDADIEERKMKLLLEYQAMYNKLENVFGILDFALPNIDTVPTLTSLKRYEDALDALVCAWVGSLFLAGKATPLGDSIAAIWCPQDVVGN